MSTTSAYGHLPDGRAVERFELGVPDGLRVAVLSLGATVQSLEVPSPAGPVDVVLGLADLEGYLAEPPDYFGAVIGRCANRIGGAAFSLDGHAFELPANDGANTLHGGPDGFHRRLWDVVDSSGDSVTLRLVSPDGDQGFPGEVTVEVAYRVTRDELSFTWTATTDAPTVVALTHHGHLQLGGEAAGSVEDHVLRVAADSFTPVGPDLLPTGSIEPVAGTALDLRSGRPLSDVLAGDDEQLRLARGLDHNYVLTAGAGPAATLSHPASGRVVELFTDQPGLQVYSGNFFDGSKVGKGGAAYGPRAGIALEPQAFPDAIHHEGEPGWPSVALRPGEVRTSTTRWRFSTR